MGDTRNDAGDVNGDVPQPPPMGAPPPPPGPAPSVLKQVLRPMVGVADLGKQAASRAMARVPVPAARQFASSSQELAALNRELEQAGLSYRVADTAELERARSAAGLDPTNVPAVDFDRFVINLVQRVKLGAMGEEDADGAMQKEFANSIQLRLANAIPNFKEKLLAAPISFDDCRRLNGGSIPRSAEALVKKVTDDYGEGQLNLADLGVPDEATAEQGGLVRVENMVEFGVHLIEVLRGLGCKPELTGSVLLSGKGYTGTPEDLDINVTTSEARDEQWRKIQEALRDVKGERIGDTYIFALADGQLERGNRLIWHRRYGYSLPVKGGSKNKVLPFMVEVKDVGGEVWQEHLVPGAGRETGKDGKSLPQWLLVDTMTRILGHRANMDAASKSPDMTRLADVAPGNVREEWRRLVVADGLHLSQEKRLWEKLNVGASMLPKKFDMTQFLEDAVRDHRSYLALFKLADDERAYEAWLERMH